MRTTTFAVSIVAAALTATVVAVPAVAAPGPVTPPAASSQQNGTRPPPLSTAQHQVVDEWLAAHPAAAQALAARAQRWKNFRLANPELAAELDKVAALPPAQRRAELASWLKENPDQKAALKQWQAQLRADRQDRRDRREDRRDRREDRREARPGSKSGAAPSAFAA